MNNKYSNLEGLIQPKIENVPKALSDIFIKLNKSIGKVYQPLCKVK